MGDKIIGWWWMFEVDRLDLIDKSLDFSVDIDLNNLNSKSSHWLIVELSATSHSLIGELKTSLNVTHNILMKTV